jgi:alkanesulfonate monooxygenase SsuD/methylene tetrahydromethanopterin reductase-like flavin-dependent oxidoreductase (luciferase family)
VLATETDSVRLGTLVLCNEFRPPAVLAKMAVTIDRASGGRLDLGIGAGWYQREFEMFGLPFPRAGVRLERLEEAVEILKLLFTGEPVTYEGRHYTLTDAISLPRPEQQPRPPIWIGGKGDRTIRIASRVADGWNAAWFSDPDAYAERAKHLGDSQVRRSIAQYAEGSAQEMVDRLAAFAKLGVEETILCFGKVPFALDDPEDLDRFATDVLPHVQDL